MPALGVLPRPFAPLLDQGLPFAVCRQMAAETILGAQRAALLKSPNNNLGVEYCKALLARRSGIRPLAVLRTGDAHDCETPQGSIPRPLPSEHFCGRERVRVRLI